MRDPVPAAARMRCTLPIRWPRPGCRRWDCAAFTLLELLLVVGIIAILIAIVVPAIATARQQSQITACASNLRQICTAINRYAADNGGAFPNLDIPASTGGNIWDVSHDFVNTMRQEGVDFATFLCPASRDMTDAQFALVAYPGFSVIMYSVWIPRLNGADIVPPSPAYAGTRFQIVKPAPPRPFAGPARMRDPLGQTNPMITDIVGSPGGIVPPANADVSGPGNPYGIDTISNHMRGTRMVGVNAGFADGHVEVNGASTLKPYFCGNWWNWR